VRTGAHLHRGVLMFVCFGKGGTLFLGGIKLDRDEIMKPNCMNTYLPIPTCIYSCWGIRAEYHKMHTLFLVFFLQQTQKFPDALKQQTLSSRRFGKTGKKKRERQERQINCNEAATFVCVGRYHCVEEKTRKEEKKNSRIIRQRIISSQKGR